MNRTLRMTLAVIFIGIIMCSAISISQNLRKLLRVDVTEQKLYTLSEGTRSILGKLRQPLKMKLYYTKTAAMKGPDQIRFFNNYYYFVESLLQEYSAAAKGMIEFEIVDPRPFSNDEADALRYGLRRIPMSEEENFFFGLVVQTQFGVTKNIPFFSPERQNFVEYDISYLIDTSIRRERKTVGILSSLPVMGEGLSGYMAQMMQMQGQQPKAAWTIVEHLKQKYYVKKVQTNIEEIEGVDILLVVHPKALPETTLFAIDQFVLKGGRTIVCVDPYCYTDQPKMQMMPQGHQRSSDLSKLMRNWGVEMPGNVFAGDRNLAIAASFSSSKRVQKIIGFLGLTPECFNKDKVITANLNSVRVFFAGVLRQVDVTDSNAPEIERTPLLSTTVRGNSWSVDNQFELTMPDPVRLMKKFTDGVEAVHMGYMLTGQFKSSFPDGIEIADKSEPNSEPRHLTGITQADTDCAVAVFSDVDFITDGLAYERSFFGKAPAGDNTALLFNTIDALTGSADLISIRSRGNFSRPFTVVNKIEAEAAMGTLEEEKRINAEIVSFQQELSQLLSNVTQGQEEIIGSSIIQKKQDVEQKIRAAQRRLRDAKMQKREDIERLGNNLRNLNTLPGPIFILAIAATLGLFRSTKKRHYISHASDA